MINTDFDSFIVKYIDTYLFDDLETICGIRKKKGNGAYLYIFAVCSGMEFLGALLREDSPIKEGRVNTSNALGHYIGHYLIPVVDKRYKDNYSRFQKIASVLIRNGLAHSYAPKGPIAVGRYNCPYLHMNFHQINGTKQLFINADILYKDFKKSYDRVKLLIQPGGVLHERAQRHYEDIRTEYKKEVTGLLEFNI